MIRWSLMRLLLLLGLSSSFLFAQQPILYNRGAVNAASLAPPGLPNAPIARGSIFSMFGESLGPAASPTLAFPLGTQLGDVSATVTQGAVSVSVFPIFVSPGQMNAVMPSTVTAGLATLRLTYQTRRSNAITVQIADSAPGIFAVSSGGYGPGVVQNFVSQANQPVNSLAIPAARGQVITIWGTGLGPVTFPDNVAPTAGDVSAPVSVTIGGRAAAKLYSGRTPCCSGVDQIVVSVPDDAPYGCWVPVVVKASAMVSNTTTMAIAPAGSRLGNGVCDDAGNPLSKLVRTPGTQAFIHVERVEGVENVNASPAVLKTLEKVYSRFYTRPDSAFHFDPYLSYAPAGSCLVHQTSGDASLGKNFRGVLPTSASSSPQPKQGYSNGTQPLVFSPKRSFFASTVAGTIDGIGIDTDLVGGGATFTIDPGGSNPSVIPLTLAASPGWTRPDGILEIPRDAPFDLAFAPGDATAPTAIVVNAYSAVTNASVMVNCLAAPGARTFTIPADGLANLPASYGIVDGSYANLAIGTLGVNKAISFSNAFAANGILVNSRWQVQSVVMR
jgi:uncharacterized protein (TIGR03437 family)